MGLLTEKRMSRQLLPTPELPIRRILNRWSLSYAFVVLVVVVFLAHI